MGRTKQDQSCPHLRYHGKNVFQWHARAEKDLFLHLAELNRGERATVIGVAQGEAFCQLCSLGLNSGAQVELVRSLSRRSLLIVRVDGLDIALRGETAETVKIRPVSSQ